MFTFAFLLPIFLTPILVLTFGLPIRLRLLQVVPVLFSFMP